MIYSRPAAIAEDILFRLLRRPARLTPPDRHMKHPLLRHALASAILLLAACGSKTPEAMLSSAKTHIEKKEAQAALIELKGLLAQNADHAEARLLLGEILLNGGRPTEALIELEKAAALNFDARRVTVPLARALIQTGAADAAIERFGTLQLNDAQANADLLVELGRAHLSKQRLEDGLFHIRKALELQPQHLEGRLLEVRNLIALRRLDEAKAASARLVAAHPESAAVRLLEGDLLLLPPAQSALALAAFEKAHTLDPALLDVYARLLPMLFASKDLAAAENRLAQLVRIAPARPQTQFYIASLALEKGEYEKAAQAVAHVLKAAPDNAEVQYLAGLIESRRKHPLNAVDHLRRSLSLNPNQEAARMALAQALLQRGDAAGALSSLQQLLQRPKPPVPALMFAADAHMRLGQTAKSEEWLRRMLVDAPDSTGAKVALAAARLRSGQDEAGALKDLQQLAKASDETIADLTLISSLGRLNRIDEALVAVEALSAKRPKEAFPLLLKAQYAMRQREVGAARQAYEKALSLDPDYMPAVMGLANLDLLGRNGKAAVARVEAYAKSHPNQSSAWLSLARFKLQLGDPAKEVMEILDRVALMPGDPVSALIFKGNLQLSQGDAEGAMVTASRARALAPEHAEVIELQGNALRAKGDMGQAQAAFQKLIATQPGYLRGYSLLAAVQSEIGAPNQVVQTFRRGLELNPTSESLAQFLVAAEVQAGNTERALSLAREMQKRTPQSPIGYLLEGDIHAQTKERGKATQVFRRGFDETSSPLLATRLHHSLLLAGQRDRATQFEAEVNEKQPKNALFPAYLGDWHQHEGRLDAAEQAYRRAIALNPEDPRLLNNLAYVLMATKPDEAQALIEQALRMAPGQAEFLDTLAAIHAQAGRTELAISFQQQAVGAAPDLHALRLQLARYLVKAQRKDAASAELRTLGQVKTSPALRKEIQQLEQSLR